ncbi:MAG: hypothetical protein JOZ43_03335 [Acidobacteriales bacterium]|nr:hypothetical protein [Terriglobales bacterium]
MNESKSGTPLDVEQLEVAQGTAHERLEGWIPELAGEDEIRVALEKAFDFRGDVAITRKDGSLIEGYIFDRKQGTGLSDGYVRLFAKISEEKVIVPYSEIAALKFDDRDPAAGKSFEAWVRKYWEKRAKGESNIGIEAEKLD